MDDPGNKKDFIPLKTDRISILPNSKWSGSDPTMSEDEVRAERTFSLRKISFDTATVIAKDSEVMRLLKEYAKQHRDTQGGLT